MLHRFAYFIGRWTMSSDNSYKGPLWCGDDKDEDDVDVDVDEDEDEDASSTNSDEDDDATEFKEFIEDPMDFIESQISSPPSMTIQFLCQASLSPISFKLGSSNIWLACPPIRIFFCCCWTRRRRS